MMRGFMKGLLLYAPFAAAGGMVAEKRQASPTTSVFTAPTATSAPGINSSVYDLSQHFCRLWRHASVYAEGKIYIDGGNTYVPQSNGTFNNTPPGRYDKGMNDGFLVLDLSNTFSTNDSTPYTYYHKGPTVPNALIEHALWFSRVTRKLYQIGGWFSFNNFNNPAYFPDSQLPASSIWEYDIDNQTWAQSSFTLVNTGTKLDRPGAAANCDAPTLNQSFIFEGYVQKRSDYDYRNYTTSNEFKFLEGMLSLDTTTTPPTLSNISTPNYIGPRMNGALVHVPVGPKGIVVQIGGQTTYTPDPIPFGIGIQNANQVDVNINMSYVDLYDVQTGYWFRQETFGVPDIPTGRSDICTVLVSAKDGSSHNIFVIAGLDQYVQPIPYEDMWVLTIPTFQWKKVHSRNGGRYGQTCHLVGENILIIGGMEASITGADVTYCMPHMPAEVFSLTLMNYTTTYDPAAGARFAPIPDDVVALIGGTSLGGAVITKPKAWSDLYLQYVFDPTLTRPPYTPTYTLANVTTTNTTQTATATPAPSTNTGAIAGGVVGGLAFIALVGALIWFLLRRRRKAHEALAAPENMHPASELPSYDESKNKPAVEISSGGELVFAPYPYPNQQDPAELQAEEQDELRPLSTQTFSVTSTPTLSPELNHAVPGGVPQRKPVASQSRGSIVSMQSGRESRQSEVSAATDEREQER